MARRVRNQHGVVSEVPDDYPAELAQQLELAEVSDEEKNAEPAEGELKERRRR